MKPTLIDWSARLAKVLDETFDIPPDVTFKIVENDLEHEVKAHKMVLGMASPVFKKVFFVSNTADKTAKEILVKETTKAAFQIMVSAVYNTTSMEDSLEDKSVDEVFAVLDLVVKYQIPELLLAVKECLSTFPILDDTVLEVAENAMQYSTLFTEGVDLLLVCAKFLKPKLKDAESIFRYIAENEDHKDVVCKLLGLMKDIAPTKCPNCLQESCQDGMGIDESQFRVGLIVTNNPQAICWGSDINKGNAIVTKLAGAYITLNNIDAAGKFTNANYHKGYDGARAFLFLCK